ncbi:MAG: hypothetical protein HS115_20195 [Spirochaetales bacterium]|nr:hypothetical protein [Spirochaetales bacterium]
MLPALPDVPAFFAARNQRGLLHGPGAFALGHSWIFGLQRLGYRPFVLDCAIRFDVFQLVDAALAAGVSAEELLLQVQVQRAFTPYQILDALQTQKDTRGTITFLLAPCKQFFDGDVAAEEAEFLLKELARQIALFPRPLLMIESSYKHKAFAPALLSLRKAVQIEWVLEETSKSPLIKKQSYIGKMYGQNRSGVFTATAADRRTPQRLQKSTA